VQVAVLNCGDYYDAQFVKLYTIFMVQLQVLTFEEFEFRRDYVGYF